MKISCERCSAQYDLDENRIPASGMTMKCPACLHQFTVRKSAAATVPTMPKPPAPPVAAPPPKPPKREIELSTYHADEGPTPLPDAAPGMLPPDPDEIDLPAPKASAGGIDLPAPKGSGRMPASPPPKPPAAKTHPSVPRIPPPIPLDHGPDAISVPTDGWPGADEIDLHIRTVVVGHDISGARGCASAAATVQVDTSLGSSDLVEILATIRRSVGNSC